MTTTAHDHATRTEREICEAFWKLLVLLHEEKLRFPIAISPERDSDHGPRLRVQVEECDFRDYFEQIDRRVMRTEDHEGAVHVHVAGICRGVPIHVLAVMTKLDACRISVDGWCATHSSRRGWVYCVPPESWVCDGCMRRVVRSQIADMCDGEHVLCNDCDESRR